MKFVSWNVNGIRACINKGFNDFFDMVDADIFAVQETKMQEGQADIEKAGYYRYMNSAIKKGYSNIIIFGGIGGALDHTIANIALVGKYAEQRISIAFVDGENMLFALHNGAIQFDAEAQGRISVFSFGNTASGVWEKGLLYELENATLESKEPLGVSNEFVGLEAKISVADGTLLIYTSRQNFENHLTRL